MKSRNTISTFLSVFLATLTSCINNEQNLGDHYYYLPDYEAIDIGYPEGPVVYRAEQRYIFDEIVIHANVISAISNKDFIVAVRTEKNTPGGVSDADEENNVIQYFIIDKQIDKVFGPYDLQKYLLMREDLGVSKKLILNPELRLK